MTKTIGTGLFWSLFFTFNLIAQSSNSYETVSFPEYDREIIKDRINALESIVTPRYTTAVEGYIKGYVIRNRAKAERILGRAVMYFPIFEKYLEEHQMPTDLKYLAIVESALVPKAVSRVGAGGLWQFMPATGAEYGLKINRYVDDRSDPHRSTDAAMKYLAKQYKRFESWELALAAYNSGAGRVNRAVRYSRSKNFWKLQRYLPRETRNYVPAFIGATYLHKHYKEHEIVPKYPDLDMQLTETILVYSYLPFSKIEKVTRIPRSVIMELNPSYKRGFVPTNRDGNYLILPKRAMPALKDYLELQKPDRENNDNEEGFYEPTQVLQPIYSKALYTTAEGDNLTQLAQIFNCAPYNLIAWNNLTTSELVRGQELTIWYPNSIVRYLPFGNQKVEALPKIPIVPFEKQQTKEEPPAPVIKKMEQFEYHQLRRTENLMEVAEKYPEVSFKEIMELNGFSESNLPVAGAKIKIKKL